jgi:hypothetical protein
VRHILVYSGDDSRYSSIANATADLLMMAAWSLASQTVGGDPIPVSIGSPHMANPLNLRASDLLLRSR